MIEKLQGVRTERLFEPGEVALQTLGWRWYISRAPEHGRHAAEGTAETAPQGGLVHGSAVAEKRSCQVRAGIAQQVVRQRCLSGAIVPGLASCIVNDFAAALPGQPGNAPELIAAAPGQGLQQLDEGDLSCSLDRIVT